MQIIAHKNSLTNYINFFDNVINKDYINGFSISIVKTKDNQIITFDDKEGNGMGSEILQYSTLEDLRQTSVIELNRLLSEISTMNPPFTKRIILNVYPLITPLLSNETIMYINQLNKDYIKSIEEIINNFPQLNISLCSINTNLLIELKRTIKNRSLGLIIDEVNPVYMEADFYILKPVMLDETIIKQELDIGKEIIISIISGDDLSLTYYFFKEDSSTLKNELLLKLTFITDYPDVFYNLIK